MLDKDMKIQNLEDEKQRFQNIVKELQLELNVENSFLRE